MRNILTIATREFKAYWLSPIAYVVLCVFLGFNNFFFLSPGYFSRNVVTAGPMFNTWATLFVFIIPAVTMRLWAEERKLGTLELLLTYPMRIIEQVIGKFLGSLAFILIGLALTLPPVITIASLGDLDWGPVIGGYIFGIFMVSAFLSIGLFFSSLTESQSVAFLLTLFALLLLNLTKFIQTTENLPGWLSAVFSWIGLSEHFQALARGVVSSKDIIYYLVFTCFFIWLNTLVLEAKKWRG